MTYAVGFGKMVNVKISFSMIITANKLISQEGKICLFSAFLFYSVFLFVCF